MRFEGKVALVTGAASGIGRATAELLAEEGAHVVVADLNDAGAKETVAGLRDGRGEAAVLDVADSAAVDAVVAGIDGTHGRLDVLVNVAGVPWGAPGENERWSETMLAMAGELASGAPPTTRWDMMTHITDESLNRMLAVHVCGTFYTIRAAIPLMRRGGGGAVVNISSGAGQIGMAGAVPYSAAKAGILGLTKSAAGELGGHGIRVNAICPGAIDTPMAALLPDEFKVMSVAQLPIARIGTPAEVARAVAFLASDDASYVTGQTLGVNGGFVM